MQFGSPPKNNISPFTIPETPRTEASSKKHKSPKTQLMEDVTYSLDNTSLGTPKRK